MESFVVKKQKLDEKRKELDLQIEDEQQSIAKTFYIEFLNDLKEKAKNTKQVDFNKILLIPGNEEQFLMMPDFILSISSWEFSKETDFFSTYNSRLQNAKKALWMKFYFQDDSWASIEFDSLSSPKYLCKKYSGNINDKQTNIRIFWNKYLWQFCLQFLLEKKYIPEYGNDFGESQNKAIKNLFDSVLLHWVVTKGQENIHLL